MLLNRHRFIQASAVALALAGIASSAGAAAICRYVPSLDVKPRYTEIAAAPQLMDAAVGFYRMDDYNLINVLSVTREGDHLSAQFAGTPAAVLLPTSNKRFFYQEGDSSLTLNTDGAGRVTSVTLHRNHLRDVPLARMEPAKAAQLWAQLSQRIDPATGGPRSREALDHLIDGLKSGHPDYSRMGVDLELAARHNVSTTRSFLSDLGPVQSVQFLGFMQTGLWGTQGDTYDVFHADGVSRWHIAVDGKGIVMAAEFGCGP